MTRQQKLDAFKLWCVCEDGTEVFEGSKTACLRFIREKGWNRRYKRGQGVTLGNIIWEAA